MNLLSESFLSKYGDFPAEMNALGKFVYYRTYSRWLPEQKRRETWKETCARSIQYNVALSEGRETLQHMIAEAEEYFDDMFHLRKFLSGRTMWAGGVVATKYPMSNFNCSFTVIDNADWKDFKELFYLLMIGTGVGFRILKRDVEKLKPVRQGVELFNHPYRPLPKKLRLESTELEATPIEQAHKDPTAYMAIINIGDSKEGWVDALGMYFDILTQDQYRHITEIHVVYDSIRPKGERLKTFGGTASGGESMVVMFDKIHRVLMTDEYAPKPVDGKIRPIHALDIANIIGSLVVVGGVRRTSEIALIDPNDQETMEAKLSIIKGHNDHRYMSNNSVFYEEKPTREQLHKHFELLKKNGEPGFVFAWVATKRKKNFKGLNPCAEVLLDSKQLCNLVTTNAMAFVYNHKLDLQGFLKAHKGNARAALRMTLVELELPNWEAVHKADRIVGVSMLGWYDMLDSIGVAHGSEEEKLLQRLLKNAVREELSMYAAELGINAPELATTMKPEGTLSKVAGGRSAGASRNRAPWYIRRVRINAADPMLKTIEALGWAVKNEVGQGIPDKNGNMIPVTTKVVEFPVESGAKKTSVDVTALEQLQTYYNFQRHYTDHNTSITVDVNPDEWDAVEESLWEHADEVVAVTFMERFTGFYDLLPEEPCSEVYYRGMVDHMVDLDIDLLNKFELELDSAGDDFELAADEVCATGMCPVR